MAGSGVVSYRIETPERLRQLMSPRPGGNLCFGFTGSSLGCAPPSSRISSGCGSRSRSQSPSLPSSTKADWLVCFPLFVESVSPMLVIVIILVQNHLPWHRACPTLTSCDFSVSVLQIALAPASRGSRISAASCRNLRTMSRCSMFPVRAPALLHKTRLHKFDVSKLRPADFQGGRGSCLHPLLD